MITRNLLTRSYKLLLTLLVLLMSTNAFAQRLTATGKVTDAAGLEVIGASVLEKGTANGVVTNLDGEFSLSVGQNATLVISFIGYKTIEVKATTNMNITLQEDNELLDEVVVIGYGSVKRKDVTTAVSTVSTKDLDQRPIVSAAQALQGKAAGVSVMQPSGEPGGGMSIRVRGTTSFNGSNDPLYVVDGVPVDNINFLSPNDIESLSILKDASSAAIYGSRAANGVVLITTKAGAEGNAKVALNVQYGMTKVAKSMDALNTEQYRELQEEIGAVNPAALEGLTDQTDWFDEVYKTGQTQNYQVSVSNGNEKMKYFLSAGYLNEKGILEGTYFKRYSFRANIDNQIRSWLNVSANISYSDNIGNTGIISGTGANRGGVVLSVINTPTYAPIWDPEKPNQYNKNFYGVNIMNPMENLARQKNNKNKENRLIASGAATISFLPNLKLKSSVALDRRNGVSTTFLDPISTTDGRNSFGTASDNRNMNTVLVFDNILTYNTNIKKHGIDVMAGSSYTKSDYTNSWINGSHFRDDKIQTLNAANKISWDGTGTGASQWAISSYFARVSYNYDSKYMLTMNMRADGSSKLHPDHRWGIFPSFSAAWRISSEKFMKDIAWIDDLKLRGGWGQTGNQSGIGDYSYLQRYNINRIPWFEEGNDHAVPGISQANLRTSDLKWETTNQTNIGLDLTVLNNRLTFSMDYYYKKTTDMLMNVSLPAGAAATTSITRNEGEMTNKGFEFAINSHNLTGEFSWDTDFNISFNKNKLTKLSLQKIYTAASSAEVVKENIVRNEPGRPLGGFYGYISDGVDPETGNLIYRDLNEDGKISTSDRTYIGDPNPDWMASLGIDVSWRRFDFSIFFNGVFGNDVLNTKRFDQPSNMPMRWTTDNPTNSYPRLNANRQTKLSDWWVEDGSFVRIQTMTLGYSIPFSKKDAARKIRLYVSADNLYTFTGFEGYDPEVGMTGIYSGGYPRLRKWTFGADFTF